jgi:putative ABC transport system ATP-binding protein
MQQQDTQLVSLNGSHSKQATPVISVRGLAKNYYMGRTVVPALRGIDLDIHMGEFVALMGPSGSGKSTFMYLVGCLDRPTSGSYHLDGIPVNSMTSDQLADVRNAKIGFVFQSFNLLPWMSAFDNVQLPLIYTGVPKEVREQRARQALMMVGLFTRAHHRPSELSGGQQQRVAIARALITGPALFLADEPTGNLDSHTSLQIIAILQELNARGMTIVLVTHEPDIAAHCQREVLFRDGRVLDDKPVLSPSRALNRLAAPPRDERKQESL